MAPQHETENLTRDADSPHGSWTHLSGADSQSDTDEDYYGLKRLFDPRRIEHLPIEEQLKRYRQRDLRKVKIYKIAASIWGRPPVRKRVFIAPRMSRDGDTEGLHYQPWLPPIQSELQPQKKAPAPPTLEELQAAREEERRTSYNQWMRERKKLRSDLDGLGLSEEWLTRKPEKTPLEERLLKRMVESRHPRTPTPPPPVEADLQGEIPDPLPVVKRPSPAALRLIEHALQRRRLRLLDLFTAADKTKKWTLSRMEFRVALQAAGVSISEVLLDDLILTLDSEMKDEINYKDLSTGMQGWRQEKRETLSRMGTSYRDHPTDLGDWAKLTGWESPADTLLPSFSPSTSRSVSRGGAGVESPSGRPPTEEGRWSGTEGGSPRRWSGGPPSRAGGGKTSSTRSPMGGVVGRRFEKSPEAGPSPLGVGLPPVAGGLECRATLTPRSLGTKTPNSYISSTGSSQHLEPPEQDLRAEQKILSSEEAMVDLRKHNREALVRLSNNRKLKSSAGSETRNTRTPICVKTGDVEIDAHCAPSTLGGDTGERVARFRQQRLREFSNMKKLCQLHYVTLSEDLLKRVLLHPGDAPPALLRQHIRQPGTTLPLSRRFAEPPKDPGAKGRRRGYRKGYKKVGGQGDPLADIYPYSREVEYRPRRMDLSTGRALVQPRVDCWMTFEQYEALTRHLEPRFRRHHGDTVDGNAFWPGHLTHKLRLYLEGENGGRAPGQAVFHRVVPGERLTHPQPEDVKTE